MKIKSLISFSKVDSFLSYAFQGVSNNCSLRKDNLLFFFMTSLACGCEF